MPRPADERDFTAQPPPAKKPLKKDQAKRPHLVEPAAAKQADSSAPTAVHPVPEGVSAANTRQATAKPQAEPRQTTSASAPRSGRRASLRLVHIEPWSVTRLAFVVSVAMMIVAVVAVAIFWIVLNITGVWGQINDSVTSLLSDDSGTFDIRDYLGFGRLVGLTLVLSAINVILMTALATIGAHLYNLAAELLGGLDVTFSDD
jgi:hypothetical protein